MAAFLGLDKVDQSSTEGAVSRCSGSGTHVMRGVNPTAKCEHEVTADTQSSGRSLGGHNVCMCGSKRLIKRDAI